MYEMKNLKWTTLGFFLVTVIFVVISFLHENPTVATVARNEQMVALSLIDEVKTPEELGLDYLSQEPEEFIIADLMDNIHYADAQVAQMTENIQIAFELGTNSPIVIRALPDQGKLTRSGFEALGYIDSSGHAQAFTPLFLRAMFYVESNNGGQLVLTPDAQQILVTDASGAFLQAQRIPTLDLIVRTGFKSSSKIYLVPRANANAICRDALNAVLNRKIRRFDSQLNLPTITLPEW